MSSSISGRGRGRGRGSGRSGGSSSNSVVAGGRQPGIPNNQVQKLLDVIESVQPIGSQMWERVARDYKIISGEAMLRSYKDVKAKFYELTNSKKKKTGKKNLSDAEVRAVRLYEEIIRAENFRNVGGGDDDDYMEGEEEVDDNFDGDGGEDGDGNNALDSSFDTYADDSYEDNDLMHLDDTVRIVEESQAAGSSSVDIPLPPPRNNSRSATKVSNSTTSSISSSSHVVKSKNSRPSGSKQTGRGTAANAMNSMVEVMKESLLHRQQMDLNKQQHDMMKFMLERQEKNAEEDRRRSEREMQTLREQVKFLMSQHNGPVGGRTTASSSSSAVDEDMDATQMPGV